MSHAALGASGSPLHHQGMSPTLPGEDAAPNYGAVMSEPLHTEGDASLPAPVMAMPNGVSTEPTVERVLETRRADPAGPGSDVTHVMAVHSVTRQIPDDGTVLQEEQTAPSAPAPAHGGESLPLFPTFQPSPLPGQSPVASRGGGVRPGSWFTRLGDYIQKRVEVTAWSSPPASTTPQASVWHNQSQVQTMMVASPTVGERRPESNSSGSVGIPQEMVQAEVARQLDNAMSELMGRLQAERAKTELAAQEARQLREKLEIYEMRAQPSSGTVVGPPPGILPLPEGDHGASSGVPANHPLPGPVLVPQGPNVLRGDRALADTSDFLAGGPNILRGDRALAATSDLLPGGPTLPGGDRACAISDPVAGGPRLLQDEQMYAAPGGIGHNVSDPGASSGVPANHPLPGPFEEYDHRSRTRSQSPSGPRAFLQGLFGMGSAGRQEGQRCDQSLPGESRLPPTANPQLPLQPPRPPPPQPPSLPGASALPGRDDNVLTTLARGIEALLQQQQHGPRSDRPETVKPGISELPHLPEYQPSTGSIDLLHWLTHIAPMMEDLSDTSLLWWQQTVKDALTWYARYSSSPPLARLQLRPQPSNELRPEWARVERRATAMMLSAIPKPIREEIIANGQMSTLDVLCKLYSVYQPGNLQEKTLVLRMLEQPEECATALQAVEGLRRWSLWRRRAASLGMAEPDASVLVRGLDKITAPIIKGSGELAFRVSLIRSTLQVDVSPSSATVTTFLQHLQAEMEQQARLGVAKGTPDSQPALRAINTTTTDTTPSPPQPATTTPTSPSTKMQGSLCRFFASDKGCRRGNGCRFSSYVGTT